MRVDAGAAVTATDIDPRARLKRYASAFRRRWYLVVLPAVVGAALGWFTAPSSVEVNDLGVPVRRTTYYRAAHVLIEDTQASAGDPTGSFPTVNLSQAAYLVNTGEVPIRVAEDLGLTADDVERATIGLPRVEVSSIEVQAVGTDEAEVAAMADSAASNLLDVLREQAEADASASRDEIVDRLDQLDREITALNTQIAGDPPNRTQLEAQQRSLSNQYALVYEQFTALANGPAPSAGLASLEGAKAEEISEGEYDSIRETIREGASYVTGAVTTTADPGSGSGDAGTAASDTTRVVLGGLVGLAAGIGLVLLLDRFDGRLRRREDVEAVTGLTVVAEIPPLSRKQQRGLEVVAVAQPRSRSAEAYRVVRGAVLFGLAQDRKPDTGATVLMVTSANPGEGKTTTVANLAAVLAEGGFSVLVVNCDFRRPRVHQYLLAGPDQDDTGPAAGMRPRPTTIPGVRMVTGLGEQDSDANPLEVVGLQRKVVERARDHVDVIVLDTAPFLATNDASELLPLTDQVLVVVRSGKTTTEAAHRTAEILERFQAPVLGVVFNDSTESHAAQYYYGYAESGTRVRERRDQGRGPEAPTDGSAADVRDPELPDDEVPYDAWMGGGTVSDRPHV